MGLLHRQGVRNLARNRKMELVLHRFKEVDGLLSLAL